MDAMELVRKNLIFKGLAGSHSYGTATPTSDTDYRGLFCADPINLLTPFFPVAEATDSTEEDTKFYELWHFTKLCLDCNPNIIEMLWIDDADVIVRTPAYDLLRQHREKLLSSKIAFTTSGYAMAQLKRIKGHNKWINNPQRVEPPYHYEFISLVQWFGETKMMPRDFNLVNFNHGFRLLPYSEVLFGLYEDSQCTTIRPDGSLNTAYDEVAVEERHRPLAVIKFNRDEYKLQKEKHAQYWTWKRNRNEARSELEEKYGYDTKHAMHLVRLLRMGLESLRDGVVIVKRPDAKELLAIRNGSMTYEEIVAYAEDMENQVMNVWYKQTKLPKRPDIKFAAKLLMDVQQLVWQGKTNDNAG